MSQLLQNLIGHKAVIMSRGGAADFQDMGTIEALDEDVIKLRKESDVVYITMDSVRMIKPFEH